MAIHTPIGNFNSEVRHLGRQLREPSEAADAALDEYHHHTMLFSTLLLLAPLASAAVHKLKLQKIPHANIDRASETQYLAEKYGAQSIHQQPLMGAGGAGRRISCPRQRNGENLYWTQEAIQGGHGVPLSSMFCARLLSSNVVTLSAVDFMNAQYFTEIQLGTPPQMVRFRMPSPKMKNDVILV
jgi:hypothetical protein